MRAHTKPMVVTDLGSATEAVHALERMPLAVRGSGAAYDERWLQMLVQRNPSLLPIDQIEPGLADVVPVCVELPAPSGFMDNLLMTPDGGVVVVEAKLWRNGEARREVVGQVLDYAKDLARWTYADLQAAVRRANKDPGFDLYRCVCGAETAQEDEASFVDAVSRNLRLGRFLILIAGDGIQESAEELAGYLQRHVSLHFTLALVELSLWKSPLDGGVFVQPKVVTRTVQIERAVVRLDSGVTIVPSQIQPAAASAKPMTITSEGFWEDLGQKAPGVPERLKAFLAQVEPLGVYADIQNGLNLKWRDEAGRVFGFGLVDRAGGLQTDYANYPLRKINRLDLAQGYQRAVAELAPGAAVRETPDPWSWRVARDGRVLAVRDLLDHADGWVATISALQEQIRSSASMEP